MLQHTNPFHAGELKAQARAGASGVADWAAGFIRPSMPDQHRAFFTQLPFLVLAGADEAGRHWVTLLDGPDRFIQSPDAGTLEIAATPDRQDPLAQSLIGGSDVGLLGIELSTRRRNRLSGTTRPHSNGFAIDVSQNFGNCPQYIHERAWRRVTAQEPLQATRSSALNANQIARIHAADTLFIGTGQRGRDAHPSNGFDASHRGGAPGFVTVTDGTHLRIPDYAGNNFFNTIGNLLENPRIGLVFVDFETGGLLHISGRARVDWDARDSHDPNAMRMIDVTIEAVIDRPAALSLRWSKDDRDLRNLVVTAKIKETAEITSFHLAPADGRPLEPFQAGQHLPVELDIPGQSAPVGRSYSLSAAPGQRTYRLSIKREPQGLASRHMHDTVEVGDLIRARRPSGDFVIPDDTSPLVLVSAGVGLTPMVSMLHAAISAGMPRPVWYVHGTRDGAHHALKSEVAALAAKHLNLKTQVHYTRPRPNDQIGVDYQIEGRMSAEGLVQLNVGAEAHYMLCGPAPFLADLKTGLEAAGIAPERIHYETFGPSH
ncbi:pyridoxamine 5'-phosphate oxidase family protein [Cognatiyoonia sp. IB215182]|uniref:FAD-binding oxidoreductase n=1 Tax=Cognatiyoonia sp. IB215182 TaxID=3097353 RepID=UPI002A0DC797|nr:pyridoxamine 5'-phosphate oxidase family protein [Cognatiyoonia sp. IB215182]MDX8350830.1 pyridoxamine 5'-phosphate oxidase family protein [Cognatiyoonia sp. IB215182]